MNLDDWNKCVDQAKRKYGKTGYGFVSGQVLKAAQRAYCAIQIKKATK